MSRRRQHLLSWSLLLGGAALAGAWFAFSPLLFDEVVDEAAPQLSDWAPPPPAAGGADPSATADQLDPDAGPTSIDATDAMRRAAAEPDTAVNEFMPPMDEIPPEALRMRSGRMRGADELHKSSGRVRFYQTDYGDGLLRLEEFRVTNGPDLVVLLAEHPEPRSADDIQAGHLLLGELKGNIGNQNYSIAGRDDLDAYQSAVIYCRLFHVVFATARLGPPEPVKIRSEK